MNGGPEVPESHFKFTDGFERGGIFSNREAGGFLRHPHDLTKVIQFVSSDANGTAGLKRALQRPEKFRGDESAWRVPAFRPGVREHDVKGSDATRWQQVLDGIGDFETEDPGIR